MDAPASNRRSDLAHAPSLRRLMAFVAITFAVLFAVTATAQTPVQDENVFVQGEKTLEGRLLAPCCWMQTLDIHESEVAHSLRLEIRRRLQSGESAGAIEADIVQRYGDKIRAVPKGGSLTSMGVWLSILVAVSGLGVGYLALRWARKGRRDEADAANVGTGKGDKGRDELDDRLDEEVNELPD
jgi:cytochrome c-type biogenesis protein CcmH